MSVDILILGAGWTSTFLIPLCQESKITCAASTRSGVGSTIQFEFQPNSDDPEPYKVLPDATTVLITFPITVSGASERLVRLYMSTRRDSAGDPPAFIQLGTTSIWDVRVETDPAPSLLMLKRRQKAPETMAALGSTIYDRRSPFNVTGRANAEVELLALSPSLAPTTVLNLAGLWGGQRVVRNWLSRVAPSKDALAGKGSLHLIHGFDLARAILAIHTNFAKAAGQRWILTDGRVYDWWDLASAWDEEAAAWVRELMREGNIRVLPRNTEFLGRILDSRDFWDDFGLAPVRARLETGD
ncbi:hypothetical protein C8F04DRAFT_1212780 [Mycena alexandri]|uniref:Uncharacterized protein n=1 Tax=Mycena alexandri TaxID=1745969 RepID=A0AAD6SFE1_9AGAR|nr:hypothetical protein C8F04DRAFT_1212780 [Mycena alexandri]